MQRALAAQRSAEEALVATQQSVGQMRGQLQAQLEATSMWQAQNVRAVQLLRGEAVASAADADAADAAARHGAPSVASLLAPVATDEAAEGAARYEMQSEP